MAEWPGNIPVKSAVAVSGDEPAMTAPGAITYPAAALPLIMRALAFAAHKHRDQRRKDTVASPYINHPIALAELLVATGGIDDAEVICAALLHDTIEDTETTVEELRREFGAAIAAVVLEVSDDKDLPKAVRKQLQVDHADSLSAAARLVKLADKTCNLRDMAVAAPKGWDISRRREYFDWAKRVVDRLGPVNRPLEAAFAAAYAQRPD